MYVYGDDTPARLSLCVLLNVVSSFLDCEKHSLALRCMSEPDTIATRELLLAHSLLQAHALSCNDARWRDTFRVMLVKVFVAQSCS